MRRQDKMNTPPPRNLADIRRELLEKRVRQDQIDATARERIAPVPREGMLAVSEQQRFLWFLYQLAPETPVYNEPHALRLRGELDMAALSEAFRGLVARHEGLRTRFVNHDGVPHQIIDPAPRTWSVPVSDGPEEAIQEWIDAAVSMPFDLGKGPLCRFSLLRVAPDDHVLMLVWHHIISDGWSARQISEELTARYAAARRGTAAAFPDLSVQPADHAAWQRYWLHSDEAAEQIGYWRESLADAVPLEFPADRPRSARPTGAGAISRSALPSEVSRAVRGFAQAEGLSLLAVMLAGYQVTLSRYTGQRDLIVGSLFAGRTRSETEPLVGFFANTVVLRGNLTGNPSFRDLVRQCQETLLDAMANQDVPFGTLVEALQPERVPGRNPLFQHLFTLMPASMLARFEFAGLQVAELVARQGTSRFDLSVQVTDQPDGGIGFWIEYSTELYDRDRIERLTSHLAVALSSALAAPGGGIESIDVLPAAEIRQLVAEWNPAPSARDTRLLHEVFMDRATQAPGRTAMRFGGAELGYGELDLRSNRLANLLAGTPVRPGQVVGVLLERGFDLPAAELGVLKAGGAWLPLDPQYPADRIAYQLADADVSVVVTTSDLADRLPADVSTVLLDKNVLDGQPDKAPVTGTIPEDVAYVIYTSGSTGKPKGVMVPHRAAVNFCAAFRELFAVTPEDRILQFSNPAFDVSVSDFFATFAAGATVVGAPRSVLLDPSALQALMHKERITFGDIPPAVLRMLEPGPLADLRALFIGMEPFGPELVNRWALPGREFHNGYGPTEVTITCVDYRCPDEKLTGPPPIGRAMKNQRAYVLDKHLRLVPVGVPGELYMAGAGLARGYLDRPDLTAEKFLPDPYAPSPGERMYATGDLARWRADGNLEFLGRTDRQVKIRGLRIELGEIEHALASYPGVRQAAVVVKEAGTPQARLIGYLVSDPGNDVDPGQVRDFISARLPLHMIPAALLCLDKLPLTSVGKIDTARLPDPEEAGANRVELTTDTQRRLAEIWCGLLGLDVGQIGAHDSFFNAGGNSLQVTQLISRIRDSFQVTLEPRDLFAYPVLEQLASRIDDSLHQVSDDAMVAQLEAEIAGLSEAELDRLLEEGGLSQADGAESEE
jgi:amino acid adenylation domain-containing protein